MQASPWLLGLLLLASCAANPTPGGTASVSVKDDVVSISAPDGGIPLADFIKLAQRLTGRGFTYRTEDLADSPGISWIGTVRMRQSEFFEFFQNMLYVRGFECVSRGTGQGERIEIVRIT